MWHFSFKNRLAFNFLISTALIVGMLFVIIYFIVKLSIYTDVNKDIEHEIAMHFSEMDFNKNIDKWIEHNEWEEREHSVGSIDPVFVQIYDTIGNSVDKSPNLTNEVLQLDKSIKETHFFDTYLHRQFVRQVQVPIFKNAKIKGYLLIAMSLEEERVVLNNLLKVLFISYLILLFSLFYITRFIAGKSILPIIEITKTTESISRENLKSRIELPQNKDELYVLSNTINDLLNRIENAVSREKQFTSDASHELRTPLAIIKGTLEVLIRKPREKQEYVEKVNFCIGEVNRLNNLVDELLLLARFEDQKHNVRNEDVYLNGLILDCLSRYSQIINDKNLTFKQEFGEEYYIQSDYYLMDIIVSNILSNAIKYSNESGTINISLFEKVGAVVCSVSDKGIGIPKEDLEKIFNPFYRSHTSEYPQIKGIGIGLSIVKRLCDLLKIEVLIDSNIEKGSTFTLVMKK